MDRSRSFDRPISRLARPAPGAPLYLMEALASAGASLLTVGIFFYTTHVLHWGAGRNFLLAAAQGLVYVVGALQAGRVTGRMPHRRALGMLYFAMSIVAAIAAIAASWAALVATAVLAFTFLSSICWPILESLISQGVDANALSRRLAVYNIVWPAVGAAVVAVNGSLIASWPPSVFVLSALAHLIAAGLTTWHGRSAQGEPNRHDVVDGSSDPAPVAGHPAPDADLLHLRTLALWVSRLALPATYAVIYGLMPMMPSLPAVSRLDTRLQTVVGGAWLAARWLTFAALATSAWWHTRPRVLVAAAVIMFVAYLGVTLAPSQIWGSGATPALDLLAILIWQMLLGMALGMIYSGSLYFGMVLSEGSIEHGGYHEALIGLGWVLGPAAGAFAEWLQPGNVRWGVTAVGTVIGLSVLAVVVASIVVGKSKRQTA